jgi:hypothetical protein
MYGVALSASSIDGAYARILPAEARSAGPLLPTLPLSWAE